MSFSNIFSRLGFVVEKPELEVTLPPEVVAESERLDEKRKHSVEMQCRSAAEMYDDMLPTAFIVELQKHNNYECLQWGGRKVGRLCNLSRNLLDLEIVMDESPLEEKDRIPVFKLLVLMCWLIPIVVKRHHIQKDVESEFRPKMKYWLCDQFKLVNDAEAELVLSGVFEDVLVGDNPVLNVFHDALRIEESQFGVDAPQHLMRTYLGKTTIFRNSSQRYSRANQTPKWMAYLQDLKGITGLVNVERAARDEKVDSDDFIG